MKYRQREEVVRGDSPYVDVRLNADGTEARVTVQYARTSVSKDVKTTTFGKLELGWLTLDDLACVARTLSRALYNGQHAYMQHTNNLMTSVQRELGA